MAGTTRSAILLLCACSMTVLGCAETLRFRTNIPAVRAERRCVPEATELRMVSLKDLPATAKHEKEIEETQAETTETEVPAAFSETATKMAEVIEAGALIRHIALLQADKAEDQRDIDLRLMKARQELHGRILLAMLAVSSLTAEVLCEQERADRIADNLQEVQLHRVRQQTLVAILIGGVTSIVTGGLALATDDATAAGITSVIGGALEGVFGTNALFHETQHEFWHRRNLLKEVWEGPLKPTLFSGAIWRYLQKPAPGNPQGQSLREELVASWHVESRLGKPGSAIERRRIELILGEGGLYQIADLRARVSMLEMLHATIRLMHEGLEELVREALIQQAILD